MATLLLNAVRNNELEEVQRLLQTTGVNIADKSETPLFCASAKGYIQLVNLFLSVGATVDSKTYWGSTSLHAAADNGQVDIVRILIKFGAEVNSQTNYGDTPLHLAAYRGFLEVVKLLVETGASLILKNSKNNTALQEAKTAQRGNVVKYLLTKLELAVENDQEVPARHVTMSLGDYSPTSSAATYAAYNQGDRFRFRTATMNDERDFASSKDATTQRLRAQVVELQNMLDLTRQELGNSRAELQRVHTKLNLCEQELHTIEWREKQWQKREKELLHKITEQTLHFQL